MSRDPASYSVDIDDPIRMNDPRGAVVAILRQIEHKQHSLMSQWGGPPRCYTEIIKATGATSSVLTVAIPPGVTDCDIAILMAGTGTVVVTSTADATGTQFMSDNNAAAPTTDAELGQWFQTAGYMPTSAGAASGRAVTVAASASWAWVNVDLTITISAVTSSLTILAIEIQPIHVPR